jgi:hypothetical protein
MLKERINVVHERKRQKNICVQRKQTIAAFLLRNFQIQSISGDDWISRVLGPRSAEKLGYIT